MAAASCVQAVVVDTSVVQRVSLLRVPSSVRELLPSKPYQPPPPDNPLPGAATEPDCCSICLVELEAGEHVTVLPCMHFYHKVGLGPCGREKGVGGFPTSVTMSSAKRTEQA